MEIFVLRSNGGNIVVVTSYSLAILLEITKNNFKCSHLWDVLGLRKFCKWQMVWCVMSLCHKLHITEISSGNGTFIFIFILYPFYIGAVWLLYWDWLGSGVFTISPLAHNDILVALLTTFLRTKSYIEPLISAWLVRTKLLQINQEVFSLPSKGLHSMQIRGDCKQ